MIKEELPTLDLSVMETIARWPATTKVLTAHGLDLCCGGIHAVSRAAAAHGVDPEALLAELRTAAAGARS